MNKEFNLTTSQKKAEIFLRDKIHSLTSRKILFLIGRPGVGKSFLGKKMAADYNGEIINLLDGVFLDLMEKKYSLVFFNINNFVQELREIDQSMCGKLIIIDGLETILKICFQNGYREHKFLGKTFNSINNNTLLFIVDTEESFDEKMVQKWVAKEKIHELKITQADINYVSDLYQEFPYKYKNLFEIIKRGSENERSSY